LNHSCGLQLKIVAAALGRVEVTMILAGCLVLKVIFKVMDMQKVNMSF